MKKPTQIIREFVQDHIKDTKNLVIIWESDGGIYMDHNDMENRDLLYMLTMVNETTKKRMTEDEDK